MKTATRCLVAASVLAGCTFDVEHHFPEGAPSAEVGIDSECAACFPYCSPDGVPYCDDSEGRRCYGCVVGCLAGKRIDCAEPDPVCWNDGPAGRVDVPVFCIPEE